MICKRQGLLIIKIAKLLIPGILSMAWICASGQFSLNLETAELPDQSRLSRVLEDFEGRAELSEYGGWKGNRQEETGFFYCRKVGGDWYIIDPDGYLFYSVGINSVVKGGGFTLPDSLQEISCNTMGCWSDESINDGAARKIAYTPRWNMMLSYKNSSQRTKDLYADGIIPVFDPQFSTFCLQLAFKDIAPLKDDRYILGHFSDNELPIYDNTTYGKLLDRFLAISDKTDANYLAAHSWMLGRKGSNYTIDDDDRLEFHGYVVGTYYEIVSTAIRKYDPNHMYLGSRLHGAAKSKPPIFREAGKYLDVISINTYGVWTPSPADMDMWAGESGKPFLVTEFYAKAVDTGLPNTEGAGWLVNTQEDRAKFFENFTLGLLAHPGSVGFHHFKYIDKETFNTGLVSLSFEWYEPLRHSFDKIGKEVYLLRQFMRKGYSGTGVCSIYTGINYNDKARLLEVGSYTLEDLEELGISDGSVSSVRVKPGYRLVLYDGETFTGDSLELTEDEPSLSRQEFSLRTSSLRIYSPPASSRASDERGRDVLFFPNPSNGKIWIHFGNSRSDIRYNVWSLTGSLLLNGRLEPGSTLLDLTCLSQGSYLVELKQDQLARRGLVVRMN